MCTPAAGKRGRGATNCLGSAPEEERRLFRSRIPMSRMGRSDELAELVSWLPSGRCSFSTGATYDLSGGRAVY